MKNVEDVESVLIYLGKNSEGEFWPTPVRQALVRLSVSSKRPHLIFMFESDREGEGKVLSTQEEYDLLATRLGDEDPTFKQTHLQFLYLPDKLVIDQIVYTESRIKSVQIIVNKEVIDLEEAKAKLFEMMRAFVEENPEMLEEIFSVEYETLELSPRAKNAIKKVLEDVDDFVLKLCFMTTDEVLKLKGVPKNVRHILTGMRLASDRDLIGSALTRKLLKQCSEPAKYVAEFLDTHCEQVQTEHHGYWKLKELPEPE